MKKKVTTQSVDKKEDVLNNRQTIQQHISDCEAKLATAERQMEYRGYLEGRRDALQQLLKGASHFLPACQKDIDTHTVVFIETSGDRSVGIASGRTTIQFDFDYLKGYESSREQIRKDFQSFFASALDESCWVRFGDECPTCGVIRGHSKSCPDSPEAQKVLQEG